MSKKKDSVFRGPLGTLQGPIFLLSVTHLTQLSVSLHISLTHISTEVLPGVDHVMIILPEPLDSVTPLEPLLIVWSGWCLQQF